MIKTATRPGETFPATILADFQGELVPCCDRHAKVIQSTNAMMGLFTHMEQASKGDKCEACVTEDAKRKEQQKENDKQYRRNQ